MIGLFETKILIMELCQQHTANVPLPKCAVWGWCHQGIVLQTVCGKSCHEGSEEDVNCIGVLRCVAGRTTIEWMIIGVKNGPLRVDGLIF